MPKKLVATFVVVGLMVQGGAVVPAPGSEPPRGATSQPTAPAAPEQPASTSQPAGSDRPVEEWHSTIVDRLYFEVREAGVRVGRMEIMIEHIARSRSDDAHCVRFTEYLYPRSPDTHDQYQQVYQRCYAQRIDGTPLKYWGKLWKDNHLTQWAYDLQGGAQELRRTRGPAVTVPPPPDLRFVESFYGELVAMGSGAGESRTYPDLEWASDPPQFEEMVYTSQGPQTLTLDGTNYDAYAFRYHPKDRPYEVGHLWLDPQGWPVRIYAPYQVNHDVVRCSKLTYETGQEVSEVPESPLAFEADKAIDHEKPVTKARYRIKAPDLKYVTLSDSPAQTWRRTGDDAAELTIDRSYSVVSANPEELRAYLQSEGGPDRTSLSDDAIKSLVSSQTRAVEKVWSIAQLVRSQNADTTLRGLTGGKLSAAVAQLVIPLCRLAELPTRMVTGAVYEPTISGKPGKFVPRTWVEVYAADRWQGVDLMGDSLEPVDATYIALAVHGPTGELPDPGDGVSPLTLFGRTSVDVLSP